MEWLGARLLRWWRGRSGRLPRLQDVVEPDGFEFVARLDVDVPLAILAMHGTRVQGDEPPSEPSPRHGRWQRSYRVLRVGGYQRDEDYGREPVPTSIDTPIGRVARDGGTYLTFLRAARTIAEGAGSRAAKLAELERLARSTPESARFARTLGRDFATRCVDSPG